MISMSAELPDLVIPSGETNSNVWNGVYVYDDARSVSLSAASTETHAETYIIEHNEDSEATNSSSGWTALQGGETPETPTDLVPPGVGKTRIYREIPEAAGSIRIKANGAVAAARTWKAKKQWTV